jgi:flagellar motor switch protein FliN/FliY
MDKLEQKLAAVFASAWNDISPIYSPAQLNLTLADLRELASSEINSALAVAGTWSAAFEVNCTGEAGSGALVCLLKSEDHTEFEGLIKHSEDGKPSPATRTFLNEIFKRASSSFEEEEEAKIHFGEAIFFDLTIDPERLAQMVGDTAWLGTYNLKIEDMESQILLIYAPNGSAEGVDKIISSLDKSGEILNEPDEFQPIEKTSQTKFSVEDKRSRHLERLLDVELDVVVRFGVTHLPLREVVHLGVGTMLELNRMVDAPVEILVNGRSLARGDVVVIDGYYGVRITSIGTQNERALSLL